MDGGPGVPVTGWSREHGDLRVPHFIGLHAIQALALVAVVLRRWRRPEAVRVKAVLAAAASYASLFLLLLWSALRGHSVVAPDATALAVARDLGGGHRARDRLDRRWLPRRLTRRHGSEAGVTPEQLFSILNLVAVAAWLPLVFLPRVRWASTVVPAVRQLVPSAAAPRP